MKLPKTSSPAMRNVLIINWAAQASRQIFPAAPCEPCTSVPPDTECIKIDENGQPELSTGSCIQKCTFGEAPTILCCNSDKCKSSDCCKQVCCEAKIL